MSSIQRRTVTAAVIAVLTTTTLAAAAPASSEYPRDQLQRDTEKLHDLGVTGVSAYVRTAEGIRTATAGVADTRTGEPMPEEPALRTASNTKSFVATVVLQLVGEGRLPGRPSRTTAPRASTSPCTAGPGNRTPP